MTGPTTGGSSFNPLALLKGVQHRHNLIPQTFDGAYDLRIANVTGRFPGHHHPNGDETWFVLQGALTIDIDGDASLDLAQGDVAVIKRGTVHSPIVTSEPASVIIINKTGFETVLRDPGQLADTVYREERLESEKEQGR